MAIEEVFKLFQEKLPKNIKDMIHDIRIDAPLDFQRWNIVFGVKKGLFLHKPIYAFTDDEYPTIFISKSKYQKVLVEIAKELDIRYTSMPEPRVRFYGLNDIIPLYSIPPFYGFAHSYSPLIGKN